MGRREDEKHYWKREEARSSGISSLSPRGEIIRFPPKAEKLDFWEKYPKDRESFDEAVRRGIRFRQEWSSKSRELKPSYQGMSREHVARLAFLRVGAETQFDARHSADEVAAVKEFLKDRADRQEEAEAAAEELAEQHRLPTPPLGYYWYQPPGANLSGLYRLWRNELGYSPIADWE